MTAKNTKNAENAENLENVKVIKMLSSRVLAFVVAFALLPVCRSPAAESNFVRDIMAGDENALPVDTVSHVGFGRTGYGNIRHSVTGRRVYQKHCRPAPRYAGIR